MTALPKSALLLETADASGVEVDDKVAILVAHQVATETAALNTQVETLKTEKAALAAEVQTLKDKLDVVEVAKVAAEKAFEDFKADEAKKVEQAKLADARKAEVAKVAPTLLEGEDAKVAERVERWVSMDEAAFAGYVAELASVAGVSTDGNTKTFDGSGTETAMDRSRKSAGTKSAARAVLNLG